MGYGAMARARGAGNYVTNRVSSARQAFQTPTPGGFASNFKTRGLRYSVGAMGGTAGLSKTAGLSRTSTQQYDKAFLARGGKRIAGVVAAGAAVGGMRNRTTSGLTKGRTSMYKY
jgi:hypothetical protein